MSNQNTSCPKSFLGLIDRCMPWIVCLSAGLFFFYVFFQLNVFDVINQPLRQAFNLNAAQLSWMSSTFVWANVVFLLPAGIILDRFPVRIVIFLSMCVCVLGTFGFACTHSWALASFYHALTGASNAFCFLSCIVLVSRWFEPRHGALVIGCIVTLAFLGGMMAHTPLAYLNHHYGWRHAVLIDGVVGLVLLSWIFVVVRDPPLWSTQHADADKSWFSGFSDVLRNRQNWFAGFYTACLNLPIMVLCALWGASYLHVVYQRTPLESSNIVSLIFMGSIVGCPLMGWLSDRIGRRKPLMIFGAAATLFLLLPLVNGWFGGSHLLPVVFFLLGFFTSTQVISYPLIAESNTLHTTGLATSLASIVIMGGGGLGQVLFGYLMQHPLGLMSGGDSILDFQRAMWLFPAAILLALIVSLCIRETYNARRL